MSLKSSESSRNITTVKFVISQDLRIKKIYIVYDNKKNSGLERGTETYNTIYYLPNVLFLTLYVVYIHAT